MCLVTLAFQCHPRYPLVVVANRDEFYDRPAAPANYWDDYPGVLAGRDLEAGGTWFGVDRRGRWATVTNMGGGGSGARSRGELPADFLYGGLDTAGYFADVAGRGQYYNGFNLLGGDTETLYYCSNVGTLTGACQPLQPGTYTLGNEHLDAAHAKSRLARRSLEIALAEPELESPDLIQVLASRRIHEEGRFSGRGFTPEFERALSAVFIVSSSYGTRATTALLVDNDGTVDFAEQSFNRGKPLGELRRFRFRREKR